MILETVNYVVNINFIGVVSTDSWLKRKDNSLKRKKDAFKRQRDCIQCFIWVVLNYVITSMIRPIASLLESIVLGQIMFDRKTSSLENVIQLCIY